MDELLLLEAERLAADELYRRGYRNVDAELERLRRDKTAELAMLVLGLADLVRELRAELDGGDTPRAWLC